MQNHSIIIHTHWISRLQAMNFEHSYSWLDVTISSISSSEELQGIRTLHVCASLKIINLWNCHMYMHRHACPYLYLYCTCVTTCSLRCHTHTHTHTHTPPLQVLFGRAQSFSAPVISHARELDKTQNFPDWKTAIHQSSQREASNYTYCTPSSISKFANINFNNVVLGKS